MRHLGSPSGSPWTGGQCFVHHPVIVMTDKEGGGKEWSSVPLMNRKWKDDYSEILELW